MGLIAALFGKKKHQIGTSELAQVLSDEFVRNVVVDVGKDRCCDEATTLRYEAKARVYQLAAVMMALKNEGKTNPRFLAVREKLENNAFTSSLEKRANSLAEIRKAEQDLSELIVCFAPPEQRKQILANIQPKGGLPPSQASWARAWLLDIGVDEWNPITCTRIALEWMDYCIMVVDTLREFNLQD